MRYRDQETSRTIYAVVLKSDPRTILYAFDIEHDWDSPTDDAFYDSIVPSLDRRSPSNLESNGQTFLMTRVMTLMSDELKISGVIA